VFRTIPIFGREMPVLNRHDCAAAISGCAQAKTKENQWGNIQFVGI
jgi:hypothetical protein